VLNYVEFDVADSRKAVSDLIEKPVGYSARLAELGREL
jgi:hypothetical protein